MYFICIENMKNDKLFNSHIDMVGYDEEILQAQFKCKPKAPQGRDTDITV